MSLFSLNGSFPLNRYLNSKFAENSCICSFDSIQDGSVAGFAPHTGFQDPQTPPGAIPRESIELRTLVFYD